MAVLQCMIFVLLAGQVSGSSSHSATADGNPVVPKARISVKDEANIPAVEPGMLTKLTVREGSRVKKEDILAQIDDREAKAMLTISEYALDSAEERAKQNIEERYAIAAFKVADADYRKDLEANRIQKGAVPESELHRKQLDRSRAKLQIEKAGNDQVLAGYDRDTKRAERDAAKMALEWRTIKAPFDGDVVKTFIHQSEWVNPGDPILRLVRFDTLYVEGHIHADDYDRDEVIGKSVTVEAFKARGRKVTVEGKIVYVDPLLLGDHGRYFVRAEVKNELINDSWLLQPGAVARMTIHLDSE